MAVEYDMYGILRFLGIRYLGHFLLKNLPVQEFRAHAYAFTRNTVKAARARSVAFNGVLTDNGFRSI